jgi:quercetin dioxygenase-like cupin family protein
MRQLLTAAISIATLAPVLYGRVEIYKGGASPVTTNDHRSGVVIRLDTGEPSWSDDVARSAAESSKTPFVVVVPLERAPNPPLPSASQPGEGIFTGISFKPIFENDKVRVIRARMEIGARETFHTHASDTVVVHLSGGEIEDAANGKTVVNKWKPGDVEFEGRGSSHSARNVGQAIDVVLVALK